MKVCCRGKGMEKPYLGLFLLILIGVILVTLTSGSMAYEGLTMVEDWERHSMEVSFQSRFKELASKPYHEQRLQQYGYLLFERPPAEFQALRHLPVGLDYVLGPGDVLIIRIFGNFFAEYEVEMDRDGKINVPEVGPIELWGLSFQEARRALEEHIKSFYAGIRVAVTMGELRSIYAHVMGEVNRPGIHELSSLSTVIQALFATRGPTRLGTLRDIRVLRDNKVISRFDLYDFLLEGRLDKDLRLQDNDVVYIPTIMDLVAIGGEVKRPGIYENKGEMHLSQLLELAGGLTPTAYVRNIKIERIRDNEEMILLEIAISDIESFPGSAEDIELKDSDLVFIDNITSHRMPDRQAFVTISGNIRRPGDYSFFPEMTLKDLIAEAGGVLPETMFHRGEIWRFISSETRQVIPFDIDRVLEEEQEHPVYLQEWDLVRIYAEYDILPDTMVGIEGEVNRPGRFKFVEGMTLRDLLFRGHEPTKDAYLGRAELFRYRFHELREVMAINLEEVLAGDFDLFLEPGDVLKVYHMDWALPMRGVHVMGAVEGPGSFELYQDMRVSDLLFLGGGLKENAYLGRAELLRLRKDRFREVVAIDLQKVLSGEEDPLLESEDILKVYRISDIYPVQKVHISGPVYSPGDYELYQDMRISDLLFLGGGLKENAYLGRAELYRYRTSEIREVISLNLEKVLSGEGDLLLEPEDYLRTYTIGWVFPKQEIQIQGAVKEPGSYELYQDMHLSDLIFLAGGLEKEAYLDLAEIYRPSYGSSEGPSILTASLHGLLEAISQEKKGRDDILLKEGDRVYIRRHITDITVKRVNLVGEVNLPGEYTLAPGERLTSIIERAGGITSIGYLFGAVMTRESIKVEQQKVITDFVNYQLQKLADERARLSQLSLTTQEREERKQALDHQERALELMMARLPEGRIVFNLEEALGKEDSPHNFILQHRDHILIPPLPQVVQVLGEVYNPGAVTYISNQDYFYYLNQLGGITPRGDRDDIYILKANGQVENKHTGFSLLKQGDIIVVPPKGL